MTRTYRIVLPLLGVWLGAWMYLSWAAIQDDALIHLRYADNLFLHRFITYDGTHPDYGASSLLYVGLLALLRGLDDISELAEGGFESCSWAALLRVGVRFRPPLTDRGPRGETRWPGVTDSAGYAIGGAMA